jgi:hypothetical protein
VPAAWDTAARDVRRAQETREARPSRKEVLDDAASRLEAARRAIGKWPAQERRVSVFRPTRKVLAPDGREWEIYAYKIEVRLTGERLPDRLASAVRSAVTALRSDRWTIEAISREPHTETYTWRTTREHKGQVLAQVEGGLARGHVPANLRNSVYVGYRRRSAR